MAIAEAPEARFREVITQAEFEVLAARRCAAQASRRPHDLRLEDQACSRSMDEQTTLGIRNSPFGGADPATTAQRNALGRNQAGLRRDRSHDQNLELKRGRADALLQSGLDG